MSGSLPARPAVPAVWPMYRAMVGVGLLCGLLIVSVFLWTRPVIERNRAEALERAIFRVLPEARSSRSYRLAESGRFERVEGPAADDRLVYAGYDEQRRLVGIALEARGMGYQDVIHVLYGYAAEAGAVIGLQVLESRETPGLGDKIESDPGFLENFERLDVTLEAGGAALAHPIEFVKPGEKRHPWQIDGITGATISSAAIARILDESASWWAPRIHGRLDDFRGEE